MSQAIQALLELCHSQELAEEKRLFNTWTVIDELELIPNYQIEQLRGERYVLSKVLQIRGFDNRAE